MWGCLDTAILVTQTTSECKRMFQELLWHGACSNAESWVGAPGGGCPFKVKITRVIF